MYKNIIFLLISVIVMSGCLNKRGISSTYYNECREYYDARGYYHKSCDENLVEFEEVKDATVKAYNEAKKTATHTQELDSQEPSRKVVW